MKKIVFLFFLLPALLGSCHKESMSSGILTTKTVESDEMADRFFVSEREAISFIAEAFKETDVLSITPVSANGTPLMYIMNFESGWKIVSADKRMPPVLAFSKTGHFNETWENNPGTKFWVKSAKTAISTIKTNNVSANKNTEIWDSNTSASVKNVKDSLIRYDPNVLWTKITLSETTNETQTMLYGPYTETAWGQLAPWNNNFPEDQALVANPAFNPYNTNNKFYTGCVSVALSQLFYYYHYKYNQPSGLYTSLNSSSLTPVDTLDFYYNQLTPILIGTYRINLLRNNYESPSSRWSQMAKDSVSSGSTSYVSDLMLDVGCRANISYSGIIGSGGSPQDAFSTFPYFGLQASMGSFQKDTVLTNLIQERPVFIGGHDYNGSGYAWIIDGYYKSTITKHTSYKWMLGYNPQEGVGEPATYEEALAAAELMGMDKPEDPMWTDETIVTTYDYYNMNLGWDGDGNGFYLMVYPGLGVNLPNNHYPENVTIFYNIIPSQQ